MDKLDAGKGYKFAVILTNMIGPSHRSRSSLEMKTSSGWSWETLWLLVFLALNAGLGYIYVVSWLNAPRVDALYADNDNEEAQASGLLSGKKSRPEVSPSPPSGAGGYAGLSGEDGESTGGLPKVLMRAANLYADQLAQPGGMKRLLFAVALFSTIVCVAAALEFYFCVFVAGAVPNIDVVVRYFVSGISVLSVGACAWTTSASYSSWELRSVSRPASGAKIPILKWICFSREYDPARKLAVAASMSLWAAEVSSMMVRSSPSLSPHPPLLTHPPLLASTHTVSYAPWVFLLHGFLFTLFRMTPPTHNHAPVLK